MDEKQPEKESESIIPYVVIIVIFAMIGAVLIFKSQTLNGLWNTKIDNGATTYYLVCSPREGLASPPAQAGHNKVT